MIDNVLYFVVRRPWLLVPLALALAVGIYAVVVIWKQHGWQPAALLIAVPLGYLAPMSLAWNFRDDIIRFSMPAMPLLLIAVVYVLWWTATTLRSRALKPAQSM